MPDAVCSIYITGFRRDTGVAFLDPFDKIKWHGPSACKKRRTHTDLKLETRAFLKIRARVRVHLIGDSTHMPPIN